MCVVFWVCMSIAQEQKTPEDIKLYYRSSNAFGATIHTQGWGVSYKAQRHASYKTKRFLNFEFQSLNHPKQEKIGNSFGGNSRKYFYNKYNSLTHFRIGIGEQRAFAQKEVKKGVQIAWIYSAGFNLGLLKPTYVDVYNNRNEVESERYDPEIHTPGVIIGRSGVFKGFDDTELIPGFYGKLGFNFEYATQDVKLKAVETGVAFDWYYKEVPLMYDTYNNQYWITLYLMIEIGNKKQ